MVLPKYQIWFQSIGLRPRLEKDRATSIGAERVAANATR